MIAKQNTEINLATKAPTKNNINLYLFWEIMKTMLYGLVLIFQFRIFISINFHDKMTHTGEMVLFILWWLRHYCYSELCEQ